MTDTEQSRVWETYSPEETYSVGEQLGREAAAGQVYTLIGDLGMGLFVIGGKLRPQHIVLHQSHTRHQAGSIDPQYFHGQFTSFFSILR